MRPSPASGQRIPCQYYPSARKFLRFTIARERSAGHVAHEILVWCPRNSYTFAAMDFGRRRGASDEHIPKWICKERATTPPPKRHAALRVALKLAWGFVARSVEYHCGYTPSLAPRPRPISAQRMYSYFGDTTLEGWPAIHEARRTLVPSSGPNSWDVPS